MFFSWEWTEEQFGLYGIKNNSWDACVVAFMVALTQYAVSQWIWFGGKKKTNRPPHHSPVYLVSFLVFCYMWDTMFDFFISGWLLPLGDQIATPLVVLFGVPLNLLFCKVWTMIFPPTEDSEGAKNDDKGGDIVDAGEVKIDEGGDTVECAHVNQEEFDDDIAQQERGEKQSEQIGEGDPSTKGEAVPSTKPKPNILYINNIKIYLTNLVIIHHTVTYLGVGTTTAFIPMYGPNESWSYAVLIILLSTNQTFFMHLFFFFSGYFVPKSFDKKGTYVFIIERAKRLGIPFVAYAFFLGPICHWAFASLFYEGSQTGFPYGIFNSGPTWFLAHLIFLGIAYAFLCGKGWSPKIACPSLLGFLGIASVLTLIAAFLQMAFPDASILLVPDFWKYYFSYVVYFFGGALAQRNNWMESIKTMSRVPIYLLAGISFLVVVGQLFVLELLPQWGQKLYVGVIVGLGTMSFNLAVTVFFMDYVDKKYFFTDFFAKGMYTAYIIHMAIPIPLASRLVVEIYEKTDNIFFLEDEESGAFYYYIGDANYLFYAFLLMWVVAMIITWPLAYGIRSIPGFSQVL